MFIWNDWLEKVSIALDKFAVNRKYRSSSFKDEKEYLAEQTKLAEELNRLDKAIGKNIEDVVRRVYPEVKLIAFDSRTSSFADSFLGRALLKGLESSSQRLEVEEWFQRATGMKVAVDRFEGLVDEEQRRLLDEKNI